ncbi:protein of unknown function [Taphrina deformans PYCC 5710]|uniref:Methyltransferase n=1 Tax=Taphrina deformans (strain PYCC 5710 / ATCC 11124 / CBS 356.35 / IMI 108563 / JCM 9778 / NBRC 8474) TaxID=1097556 RepID=R4XEE3_TAPDE|nr:protein of unknown function [Taphrina deformans PYCC 5710]|eukprot:CCG84136.1 protein of unknown function [Taphrina deformans PYCC 5710]
MSTTTATATSTTTTRPWTFTGKQPDYTTAQLHSKDGKRVSNFEEEPHQAKIHNIRTTTDPIGIDVTGFDVRTIPSAFSQDYRNFENDEKIKSEYYPEVIAALKEATGGREVFVFDHTIRRRAPGIADDDPSKRQPVALVHIDQTPLAAEKRVVRHLGDRADELLKKRYQLINVWRPIQHSAEDHPLAVASYTSIDAKRDLIPTKLVYPAPTPAGETYNVSYNPTHKFYYVKAQTPEEVTFIKCFDSDGTVARLTPHTAFTDPNTDPAAPLRQSIEVRCLVFHD